MTAASSETPFFAGSVLGLRAWIVTPRLPSAATRIESLFAGAEWRTGGEWTIARCGGGTGPGGHSAPRSGCECGLYAYHPESDRAAFMHALHVAARVERARFEGEVELYGVIEASGRIEVHREGFRAERARPLAFVTSPEWSDEMREGVKEVAELYGAGLLLAESHEKVIDFCQERGGVLGAHQLEELVGERERRAAESVAPVPPLPAVGHKPKPAMPEPLWKRIGSALLTGLAYVLAAGWYLLWGGFFVLVAGGLLFGWLESEPKQPPAKVRSVSIDRDRCRVMVTIDSDRGFDELRVRVAGRLDDGEGLGHFERGVGPIPKGRSTQRVAGMERSLCDEPQGFAARVRVLLPIGWTKPVSARTQPLSEPRAGTD